MLLACSRALAAEVHLALNIDKLHGAEYFRCQPSLVLAIYCSQPDDSLPTHQNQSALSRRGFVLSHINNYTYSLRV
jgi:hypothetical protein